MYQQKLDPMFAVARLPFFLHSLPAPTRRFLYLEIAEASEQTSVDTEPLPTRKKKKKKRKTKKIH